MKCGNDAADKGGARRYDGCGRTFLWLSAPQYKVETVFILPQPPRAALGIRAGTKFLFSPQELLFNRDDPSGWHKLVGLFVQRAHML